MSVPSSQLPPTAEVAQQTYPFALADLPYAYDALEPHIDQKTLQIHHRGHHATYVKKLNEALAKAPQMQGFTLAQLLTRLDEVPAEIRTAVKNNGGGHLNHDFFWNCLAPPTNQSPGEELAQAINAQFGSFDGFRKQFSAVAEQHFASGWVALACERGSRKLEIVDLKDHEVLDENSRAGLLIIDIWEHAYYVKYQNRRPEFIQAFWNIVDWEHASEIFSQAANR